MAPSEIQKSKKNGNRNILLCSSSSYWVDADSENARRR